MFSVNQEGKLFLSHTCTHNLCINLHCILLFRYVLDGWPVTKSPVGSSVSVMLRFCDGEVVTGHLPQGVPQWADCVYLVTC